jgi:hypothetical protein
MASRASPAASIISFDRRRLWSLWGLAFKLLLQLDQPQPCGNVLEVVDYGWLALSRFRV